MAITVIKNGDVLTLEFDVINNNINLAIANVTSTFTVGAGMTLDSVVSTGAGSFVDPVFTTGTLAAGTTDTLTATVTVVDSSGDLTLQCVVATTDTESDAGNNTVTKDLVVEHNGIRCSDLNLCVTAFDLSTHSVTELNDVTDAGSGAIITTAERDKVGHLTVTQAVDLDTMESDVSTNNAKVTNATHTGDVTGSGALTLDSTAISGKGVHAGLAGTEEVLINDGGLQKTTTQDIANLAPAGDMLAATYDPNTVSGDAFDMDNMVEGATTKILTDTERSEIAANTLKNTNVSTNLSFSRDATTVTVESSDGTNAILPEADTTNAGVLGSDKWDEIVANSLKVSNVDTSLIAGTVTDTTYGITSDGGIDDIVLPQAVASTSAGVMSGTDKNKLDNIEANATADQSDAEIKTAYENNANTNAFTDTEQTKLSLIEDSADVTDEANVTAALDNATLLAATLATADLVLIQDFDATKELKTVTPQSIANLKVTELSEDTTPVLGGTLDLNDQQVDAGAGSDVTIKLGDAAGSNKLSVIDSGEVEIFAVDSDGNTTMSGGFTPAYTSSAAGNYTVLVTDMSIKKTGITGGGDTVTLPSAPSTGQMFMIYDASNTAGTNNITIATAGSENINGSSTQTIGVNYGYIWVQFDGTNYFITNDKLA